MRRFFWQWIISAIALWLTIAALRGGVHLSEWYHVLWLAPLLGLLNGVVSFVNGIINLLALPVNLVTLGCFGFLLGLLLNGVAIYLLGANIPGIFQVDSVWWGLALAVVLAMVNSVLNVVLGGNNDRR